jgi:uncharacterized protein (TIGR02246 family)
MTSELTHGAGQDLLAAWKRAWEARDADAFVALFTEDADARFDPFSESSVGANAIRASINQLVAGARNTEFDAERIWVTDRSVLASWHGASTDPATAERTRHRGFLAFDLAPDGRIARLRGWPLSRVVGIDSTLRPDPSPAATSEGP